MEKLNDQTIYLIATLAAAVYVILQEFKIHNLGGANTYDPYDVVASIIGLITVFTILKLNGFLVNTTSL